MGSKNQQQPPVGLVALFAGLAVLALVASVLGWISWEQCVILLAVLVLGSVRWLLPYIL